ncbi:heavy metal efflux pump, CzcA family [Gluconacetobacter diazotrophicus PA1 5]|uniref:Efflux RND transporter permease subunit n=2 Tax=Gluconacetobacter diazotrophicus TaxID=33996 RepID=A0A7W4I423_GLUDI|nr:CusA/CzcA family heavy metal efflux RND transporter [Gluconacetobacter diazotrophicus]ACI50477.1 heavy metal efflux pump, CzcA family [Gluconacetobacter diazotrophicus PA1 5]MBB2155673.1 efflux RND transporter permease subunit [Gluconacetobacter diazotrophicus]TWA98275.1 cobalt-zinc-cadmium resistance protein CzcA [Gluconacetobacter diazotrophicus]CAP56381.1 putative cobalt-zinc-cadmium resistance protein [Gluconacetobacter diazotrophicus PA1 5]
MINQFIAICLRQRRIVFAAMAVLVALGALAWHQIPVEAYPDLGAVNVQITTQVPGLAAEEIEQQITIPLERLVANTPGLVDSRSSSTFGLSLITLIFRDGTDVYFVRQQVAEQMAQATLPMGATPSLGPVTGPSGEIYRYTLQSDSKNLMQLSDIQKWIVIPALMQVQGVAAVNNFGGFTIEYQIVLNPSTLFRYGVGVNDVITALQANNANAGGGRITRGEQSYIVRGVGMVHTMADMGAIAVTQRNGVPVLIRDLGQLQLGHQVREGILGMNGNSDTIEGIVTMLSKQNPSLVLHDLHGVIDQLQARLAPMGVRIVPYIDRDRLVQTTTDKVTDTVVKGVGLVFLILVLFLGSPRSAIVAAVTIPLALATVFVVMHLLGMPANLFSLGAIDFGVIVDGAIVVTEAILRIREEHPTHTMDEEDILAVTKHIGKAIFFATLIIIVAYGPLFAFEGAEGKLFEPMAFTVSFALLGALLCAITLTPALAYLAMRKPHRMFHNVPLEKLHHAYRRWLGHMVDRPWAAYLAGAIAFALVLWLGGRTGREFLPDLDEGALWLQIQLPSGLSLDKAGSMADEIRAAIHAFPETSYVATQLGRNDSGTDPWSPSHIEAPVGLTPYATWPHGENRVQFVKRLHDRLAQIPGISFGISQPIADNMNDLVGGAHSPLVLRVYGDDFKELRRIGNQVVDILKQVPGTADASIFQEPEIPQMDITVDRAAAARYGITGTDVMNVVQNMVGDAPVGQVYVADRIYSMTAHMERQLNNNLPAINQIPLTGLNGARIPLGLVAHVSLQTGEANIAHEMNHRQITIRVDNGQRPLSQYLADAQARINSQVHFDAARYHLEWAGTFQQEQRAQARLTVALGIMFAVMLVLLFGQFGRIRQAVLVLAVVPMATLGGLVALNLRGETLNIATAVGFIALFGVAIQNGIIMVSAINRLRDEGMPLRDAVLEGASERFRPVLMTATVASMGMLPAALATGIGTDVQRGLATVVVGGLGIATLLTLFILPTYYCELEEWCARRDPRREARKGGVT